MTMSEELQDYKDELNRLYQAIGWRLNNGINQGAPERQWLEHQQDKIEGVLFNDNEND